MLRTIYKIKYFRNDLQMYTSNIYNIEPFFSAEVRACTFSKTYTLFKTKEIAQQIEKNMVSKTKLLSILLLTLKTVCQSKIMILFIHNNSKPIFLLTMSSYHITKSPCDGTPTPAIISIFTHVLPCGRLNINYQLPI